MSKIIIMDIADGKVSYIKGEEVVSNIADLEARAFEIDEKLSEEAPDYSAAIKSLEDEAEKAIAEKTKEVDEKMEGLKKELNDYIDSINFELENHKETLNKKHEEESQAYADLVKERNGIRAILDNISQPVEVRYEPEVAEDRPEEVTEDPIEKVYDEAEVETSVEETYEGPVEKVYDEPEVVEEPSVGGEVVIEKPAEVAIEEKVVEVKVEELKPQPVSEPIQVIPAKKRIIF